MWGGLNHSQGLTPPPSWATDRAVHYYCILWGPLSIGLRLSRSCRNSGCDEDRCRARPASLSVALLLPSTYQHWLSSMRRLMLLGRHRRRRSLFFVRHRRCTAATFASSYCWDGITPRRSSCSFAGAVAVIVVVIVFVIVGAYSLNDTENWFGRYLLLISILPHIIPNIEHFSNRTLLIIRFGTYST